MRVLVRDVSGSATPQWISQPSSARRVTQRDFAVEPEFGGRAEEVGEAQGCVASDGAPSIQDLGHAVGWNIELPRKLRGAHAKFLQFFGQMFARVNSGKCHDVSPNGNQQSPRSMGRAFLRVIQSKSASGH